MADTPQAPKDLDPAQKKEYTADEREARRQEEEVQSRPDGGGIRSVPTDAREDVEREKGTQP